MIIGYLLIRVMVCELIIEEFFVLIGKEKFVFFIEIFRFFFYC